MTDSLGQGDAAVRLVRDERGLALVGDGMELRGDFSRMLPRLRQGRLQQELLVKAARIKGVEAPTAVDCTAGLGRTPSFSRRQASRSLCSSGTRP